VWQLPHFCHTLSQKFVVKKSFKIKGLTTAMGLKCGNCSNSLILKTNFAQKHLKNTPIATPSILFSYIHFKNKKNKKI
jgi:hypothetical protein